jgi:hypothetical protein
MMFSVRVFRLQCCKSRLSPNACKIKLLRYGVRYSFSRKNPTSSGAGSCFVPAVWDSCPVPTVLSKVLNTEDPVNHQIASPFKKMPDPASFRICTQGLDRTDFWIYNNAKKPVSRNRNYFLLFRFRFKKVTVTVPVPAPVSVPASYLDYKN